MKNVTSFRCFTFLWCGFGYKTWNLSFHKCGPKDWYWIFRGFGFGFNFYRFPKAPRY